MRELRQLLKTIRVLRSGRGCPWDRAQRLEDYQRYLLEEVYELIEELRKQDFKAAEEELGDIFLILVVITEFLKERGQGNLKGVLKRINRKLILRHPHVFAKEKLKTKEEVYEFWITNKAKIKKRQTLKDRLPQSSPALLLAELFLKEYFSLKKGIDKVNPLKSLKRYFTFLFKGKIREAILCKIILELTKLAYEKKINLELALRQSVLKEAERVYY